MVNIIVENNMDKRISDKEFVQMFKSKIIDKDTMRETWENFTDEEKSVFKKTINEIQRWCYMDGYFYIQKEVNKYVLKNFINLTKVSDIIDDIGDKQRFVQTLNNTLWGVSNHEYFYEDNKRIIQKYGLDKNGKVLE